MMWVQEFRVKSLWLRIWDLFVSIQGEECRF